MGTKHPDLFGAFGCSACHDEIDRRTTKYSKEYTECCFYDAMVRTQEIWLKEGLISVK
jgi:hypothetical protein